MTRGLSAALSTLLPTAEQTLLLRACLDETHGAAAWAQLDQLGPEALGRFLTMNRRLLPLLEHADGRAQGGLGLPPAVCRQLTAVSLREKERSAAFRRGAREVLGTLRGGGCEVMVLRGAALAELAYPFPHLRHCHDLDLLVRGPGACAVDDRRASRHRSPFSHPRAQADDGPLWDRSRALDFGGHEVRVMAPADLLVHVCGHAYYSAATRETLAWVTDVWFTLAAWPDLDWEIVVGSAQDRHLGMASALLLGYLCRELGVPAPAGALERLQEQAVAPVDRDIALELAWRAARRRSPSRLRAVLSAGAGAPSLVRWRLAPSFRAFRAFRGGTPAGLG